MAPLFGSKKKGLSLPGMFDAAIFRAGSKLFVLLLGSSVFFAGMTLLSAHRSACDLVALHLREIADPLAREAMLGDSMLVREIFDGFSRGLKNAGISSQIRLVQSPDSDFADLSKSNKFSCHAGFLRATVIAPVTFANSVVGVVAGSVGYVSWFALLSQFSLLSFGILAVGRMFKKRFVREVEEMFLKPASALSQGRTLDGDTAFPEEIRNIDRNIKSLTAAIREREQDRIKLEKAEALAAIATKVAHDIRSPLFALQVLNQDSHELPEATRTLVRNAIRRIQHIALDLLKEHGRQRRDISGDDYRLPSGKEGAREVLILNLVEEVVSESAISVRDRMNVKIDLSFGPEAFGLVARIDENQFKRILSNLINNSLESLASGDGEIKLRVFETAGEVGVSVADNGKGIPAEFLPRLTEKNFSYGKRNGSGLGLYYAKTALADWHGGLEFSSEESRGTTVVVKLPKLVSPSWFVPSISLPASHCLVILDNEPYVHAEWDRRIGNSMPSRIFHFDRADKLKAWLGENLSRRSQLLFLIDHELGDGWPSGLDLISSLQIEPQSILVTAMASELEIQSRCAALNVRLLAKSLVSLIPIVEIPD